MGFSFQAAYDQLNAGDDDYRYYASLAQRIEAQRVIDLGCGTGVLARLLAADGREVVGIDPDPEMLQVAAAGDADGRVDWRLGTSKALGTASADLVLMTGHVAQLFTTDADWAAVLRDVHHALRPGGMLACGSRNPDAEAWGTWTENGRCRPSRQTQTSCCSGTRPA